MSSNRPCHLTHWMSRALARIRLVIAHANSPQRRDVATTPIFSGACLCRVPPDNPYPAGLGSARADCSMFFSPLMVAEVAPTWPPWRIAAIVSLPAIVGGSYSLLVARLTDRPTPRRRVGDGTGIASAARDGAANGEGSSANATSGSRLAHGAAGADDQRLRRRLAVYITSGFLGTAISFAGSVVLLYHGLALLQDAAAGHGSTHSLVSALVLVTMMFGQVSGRMRERTAGEAHSGCWQA